MKVLLMILVMIAPTVGQCDIVGKISSSTYQTLPSTKVVVAVDELTGNIYTAQVDNANYTFNVPCSVYTIGSPSVRRYYFRSVTITAIENFANIVNLVGILTRTKGGI